MKFNLFTLSVLAYGVAAVKLASLDGMMMATEMDAEFDMNMFAQTDRKQVMNSPAMQNSANIAGLTAAAGLPMNSMMGGLGGMGMMGSTNSESCRACEPSQIEAHIKSSTPTKGCCGMSRNQGSMPMSGGMMNGGMMNGGMSGGMFGGMGGSTMMTKEDADVASSAKAAGAKTAAT